MISCWWDTGGDSHRRIMAKLEVRLISCEERAAAQRDRRQRIHDLVRQLKDRKHVSSLRHSCRRLDGRAGSVLSQATSLDFRNNVQQLSMVPDNEEEANLSLSR